MSDEPTGADPDGTIDVATDEEETVESIPSDLSPEQLYREYQSAKKFGPVSRQEELRREISKRWEERLEHEEGLDPVDDISEV